MSQDSDYAAKVAAEQQKWASCVQHLLYNGIMDNFRLDGSACRSCDPDGLPV